MEFLNALFASVGYFVVSSNTLLAALVSPLLLEQMLHGIFAYLLLGERIHPLDILTFIAWVLGSLFR